MWPIKSNSLQNSFLTFAMGCSCTVRVKRSALPRECKYGGVVIYSIHIPLRCSRGKYMTHQEHCKSGTYNFLQPQLQRGPKKAISAIWPPLCWGSGMFLAQDLQVRKRPLSVPAAGEWKVCAKDGLSNTHNRCTLGVDEDGLSSTEIPTE